MAKVGIIGGSGYTGAELLRLLAAHPDLDVAHVTGDTAAGSAVADLYPSLAAGVRRPARSRPTTPPTVAGLDLVFLGAAARPQPADRRPSCAARSATSSTWPPTSG